MAALSPTRVVDVPKPGGAAVASRDELALRALTVARRTALGVLGDREAAADVAQEVALQVVMRRGALRDPDALDAWVHRIAVRAALREAGKARRRRAAEEARVALRGGVPPDDDPGDADLAVALAVLDGLPPRQRAALTLRYLHDLPDAAIARALRCRPGTVRSLLSRGRDAVRTRIDEDAR
ncbi:ECF RNA polymerase sigma factor SigE [Baekduia alba]|uniref:RNA polymerase sigma factor n=1 Tax=Baekduia alba TaxID=2997333 RepID=UPI0023422AC9|nr:sigma-70 family RNA polymerase sigma factor [Baekduia alba]WCB92570.1 ECF RNA polymerase sigma factor SigE [Baekduia alba]